MLKEIIKVLDDKKAHDIQAIQITDVSNLADYMVICSGTSTTQVRALADAVDEKIERNGDVSYHKEGSSTWVLLDYGDIIVNVFYTEDREFYKLENLWSDGIKLDIEELLK